MSGASNRWRWTAGIFLWTALLGASLQLRGALLPEFGTAFGLSAGRLGLVSTVGVAGFLPTVVIVGTLAGRLDGRRFVLAGALLAVVGLGAIAAAPSYAGLLVGMATAGAAAGLLNAFDRPIVSHLYPSRRTRMYNLQDMVWAVGATAGPLLATAVLSRAGWRSAYLVLAVAFVPIAVAVLRTPLPTAVRAERPFSVGDLPPLFGTPRISLMAGCLLLASVVESGLFTWLPYFASGIVSRSTANLALSAFLAAYVPGRLAFSAAAGRVPQIHLVIAAASLSVPVAVLALVVATGPMLLPSVFGLGFLVAGFYPTLLSWGTDATPEWSAPVNAIALGTSGTGFLVFPVVMGLVAEASGIRPAMWLVVGALVGLAVLSLGARVLGRGSDPSPRGGG